MLSYLAFMVKEIQSKEYLYSPQIIFLKNFITDLLFISHVSVNPCPNSQSIAASKNQLHTH